MEFEKLIQIIVTVLIAVIGWIIAHWFTSNRDQKNKRREIQTKFLIDAYQKIESSIEPAQYTKEWGESLQSAIADIHLFGTKEQIRIAQGFSEKLLSKEVIDQNDLKQLLHELRNELRNELGLEHVNGHIGHIRIYESQKK